MKRILIDKKITKRDNDCFNRYLKEVAAISALNPDEELILAEKASKGDKDAINELVEKNLRFVISVSKKYASPQVPIEDLVNEGNIGLMIAAEKFNPNTGFKFISYAVWWIRKIIMEHLSKHSRLVRLPSNKINSLSKLDREISELEQKFGRNICVQEAIDLFYNENQSDRKFIKKKSEEYELLDLLSSYHVDSLDANISNDESNGMLLSETISDESIFKSTDNNLLLSDIKYEIKNAMTVLKPRDKKVMVLLFGLDGDVPRTMKDVSEEIGVSREMVRQIKEKSLKKMKEKLNP
jgi:RNA polymerase primary sigma factor